MPIGEFLVRQNEDLKGSRKTQNERNSTIVRIEEIDEDEYLTLEDALETIDC